MGGPRSSSAPRERQINLSQPQERKDNTPLRLSFSREAATNPKVTKANEPPKTERLSASPARSLRTTHSSIVLSKLQFTERFL